MTAAELERKLKLLINEEGLSSVVESLGDICHEAGDTDAGFYLWNAAKWLGKSPIRKVHALD